METHQSGSEGAGTQQCAPATRLLSPLLANIALTGLDDHFAEAWQAMGTEDQRRGRRKRGQATYRLIRYADDWVVLVAGTRGHAEHLRDQAAAVLAPAGLRLSATKTRVVHIDEGFDFLGFRIQRHRKRGTNGKQYVYTYPTKTALATVKRTVKTLTGRSTTSLSLPVLLSRLNPVLRGWTNYFRHGVSKATFAYLARYTRDRVIRWLRRKHRHARWKWLRAHYLPQW